MALRLIQGGRASDGLPGLLIEHAGEVATMAGGLRVGSGMDDASTITAPGGDPQHEAAPAVACWEGRILAAGPRVELLRTGTEARPPVQVGDAASRGPSLRAPLLGHAPQPASPVCAGCDRRRRVV